MDLTLSRRGDYVTRAALSLARTHAEGEYRKIRQLVEDTDIPATFAAQILADLVRAGLVTSKAGKHGGYRLTRQPDAISILEVVEAAEGTLRPERCALSSTACRWEQVCPLHETWTEATQELRTILARTSLEELEARDAAITSGSYSVPGDAHRSHPTSVELIDQVHVEMGVPGALEAIAALPADLGPLLEDSGADVSVAPDPGRRRTDEPMQFLVTWRVAQRSGVVHFEGAFTVTALDEQRCALDLRGVWRLDGPSGDTPDEVRRRAGRAVRVFLRNLARALET